MTAVLPVHSLGSLFSTDGPDSFSRIPLRRSSSHSSFINSNPSSFLDTRTKPTSVHAEYVSRAYSSTPSTAPSSPRLSQSSQPSYTSTPTSSLSLDNGLGFGEDDIQFPSYNDGCYLDTSLDDDEDAPCNSPTEILTEEKPGFRDPFDEPLSKQNSTPPLVLAGDDTLLEHEPTRHIDYLSHDWTEEEIWSSWRHVVSRRGVYTNSIRLENAAWRSWAKKKHTLGTIMAETLNWMKDCDVTWLYGPLQTSAAKSMIAESSPPPSQISRGGSFLNKKPILKKRSASEAMLQKSLSANMLLKHATTALKAQQQGQYLDKRQIPMPPMGRASSDSVTPTNSTATDEGSDGGPSALPSLVSSGLQTPVERKHIHFDNEVKQFIAVDCKCEDEEEDVYHVLHEDDDSESDDGVIMMKEMPHRTPISNRNTPRNSFSSNSDNKTIAELPPTTLNYRGDTPEPAVQDSRFKRGGFWNNTPKLSPSPSQETLRPPNPSANFLLDEDDEVNMNWQPSGSYSGSNADCFGSQVRFSSPSPMDNEDEGHRGMRRTPSGMFMPYEDDEEDLVSASLFGKVVDTVNTARDIAHVIWNVGWRR
ncbi:MAG: hypothetical protein M1834_004967 [Cirrosporium novae-zelandiae]|nr:MAG: hypothetical protein M1834_004967 [Cirrosporium novae-zelandiae]